MGSTPTGVAGHSTPKQGTAAARRIAPPRIGTPCQARYRAPTRPRQSSNRVATRGQNRPRLPNRAPAILRTARDYKSIEHIVAPGARIGFSTGVKCGCHSFCNGRTTSSFNFLTIGRSNPSGPISQFSHSRVCSTARAAAAAKTRISLRSPPSRHRHRMISARNTLCSPCAKLGGQIPIGPLGGSAQ